MNIFKCIHHSINTTGSQILIIAQTLKTLDFLLKKSVLTTVVFYTHKKTQEMRAFIVQLRDPKNDFIFNFNFDDKMKIFEQFEFGTK